VTISESAKQGINLLFTRAAKTNLALSAGDHVEITPLPGNKLFAPPEKQIAVLTIASYLFRLLTIFHFTADRATTTYFGRENADTSFEEDFGEVGNLCCGAMNRDLHKHFLHLGMSTPDFLASHCLPFLTELKPGFISQHKITINDSVSMHATLCLCAYAPIDFRVDEAEAEDETGALEMF